MSTILENEQFEKLVSEVKAELLSQSQGVGDVEVVDSLDGINSLPSLKNGNQVVEAPLSLLSAPATEAAEKAYEAIENANDTASHPTYIGEDNYVYVWNKSNQTYDKTNIYVRGEGFKISKTYPSIADMEADSAHGLKEGDFVLINTNDVENPDNAKIYVVDKSGKFSFLVDMSGAIGFAGKTPQFSIGTITIGVNRADASVSISANGTDSDGNPRYKLNIKIPSVQLSDLTDAEIALLQKPASDMIAQLKATDNSVKTAEAARVTAENERKTAESARKSAETARATAESERSSNETTRTSNENRRETNEDTRISNETNRESAETKREQAKAAILALNEELKTHPPRINDNDNWEIWDAVNKVYNDTGITAQGKSPIIQSGTWWVWDDSKDSFVNTGQSVNTEFVLERENVESVLGGIPSFYVEEWKHTDVPFRSGAIVKFNQEFYFALKDTSLPPVDLLLLGEGIIAKVDEHTYATKGSYDAEGNKDDWQKIPYDELRLSSRYGTLNGEEVDVRTLATAEEVYQLEPNLYIDFVKGTINGMKFGELIARIAAIEKKLGI